MQALLISTFAVALAEIGDKTQLLALVLAARYRKPWPIVAGILVATLANHAASAWLGAWLAGMLSPAMLRWLIVSSFLAVAIWALVPDKLDDGDVQAPHLGTFVATLIAFFLVEIGRIYMQLGLCCINTGFHASKRNKFPVGIDQVNRSKCRVPALAVV